MLNTNTQMTVEQELAQLRAENAKLKLKQTAKTSEAGRLSFQVSQKGAVSLYGMGRFPVTLYGEQWIKLAAILPEILEFIKENDDKLTKKPAKPVAQA